jgi:ribA/ribD-fused uncharacterized protein
LADLELRIGVLEQNQESIPELEIKVDNLLKQVENRVTSDLEAKIKHLEKQLHDANEEASDAKTNVLTLTESLNEVTKNCSNIDNYLRKDNLLFHNVKESKDENCFQVIRDLMAKMGIENARQLPIVRCHRLKGSRNPPIICRFHFYGDRQQVFENRFKLKGTRVFIEEHFPDEVIQKRKILFPFCKAAKAQKMKCFLKGDKLMLNNISYSVDSLADLPNSLKFMLNSYKQNDDTTVFFGYRCPLSNFHQVTFTDEYANTYHSTEQYLQHKKALLFQDEVTASKIMKCETPLKAKALSYEISKVDETVWQQEAQKIMKKGLFLKFNKSEICKEFLLNTGTRTLGEASPTDRFWGIGVGLADTLALNEGAWKGQNHMGTLLQEIRELLSKK